MQSEPYQPWHPNQREIESSNIYKNITELGLESYQDLYRWSIEHRPAFWDHTVKALGIRLQKPYTSILNIAEGVENSRWLQGSRLNIVDSCFQSQPESIAVTYQSADGILTEVTQKELEDLVNRIANGLQDLGLIKGDLIAIDMPMTMEAVAIYLAGDQSRFGNGNYC